MPPMRRYGSLMTKGMWARTLLLWRPEVGSGNEVSRLYRLELNAKENEERDSGGSRDSAGQPAHPHEGALRRPAVRSAPLAGVHPQAAVPDGQGWSAGLPSVPPDAAAEEWEGARAGYPSADAIRLG